MAGGHWGCSPTCQKLLRRVTCGVYTSKEFTKNKHRIDAPVDLPFVYNLQEFTAFGSSHEHVAQLRDAFVQEKQAELERRATLFVSKESLNKLKKGLMSRQDQALLSDCKAKAKAVEAIFWSETAQLKAHAYHPTTSSEMKRASRTSATSIRHPEVFREKQVLLHRLEGGLGYGQISLEQGLVLGIYLKRVATTLGLPLTVLEAGCGVGFFSAVLAHCLLFGVVGVEIEPGRSDTAVASLATWNRSFPPMNLLFQQGNALEVFQAKIHQFGIVYAFDYVWNVAEKQEMAQLIAYASAKRPILYATTASASDMASVVTAQVSLLHKFNTGGGSMSKQLNVLLIQG